MIICPDCKTNLILEKEILICNTCEFKAVKTEGTIFFSQDTPDVNENYYNPLAFEVHNQIENYHFWFKIRKEIIRYLFNKWVKKNEEVIEIGAGTGAIASMLVSSGYNVAVGDLYKEGLEYVRNYDIKERYQFDLLKSPFKEHFDTVGMFDVLEHIEDHVLAVKNLYQLLKPGGKVIMTLPAHQWLWSCYDDTHKRRYELSNIKVLLKNNGFKILEAKNFFISILPLLYIRALVNKKIEHSTKVIKNFEEEAKKLNPLLNNILFNILTVESKILKYISPSIGGSILVVARKP